MQKIPQNNFSNTCKYQINNVTLLQQTNITMTVEQAKQVLKDNGYYVENLWQVADVQTKFDVDAETAQEILDKTLKNPNIFDDIWEVMEYVGEEMGFELLEL